MIPALVLGGCTEELGSPDYEAVSDVSVDPLAVGVGHASRVVSGTHPGAPGLPHRTIVIGGGVAGMAAAMDLDGEVVIVDAAPQLGGRARLSGGLMFMVGTEEYAELGVALGPEQALADWETLTGAPPTEVTRAWLEAGDSIRDRLVDMGLEFRLGRYDPILERYLLHTPEGGGPALADTVEARLPDTVQVLLDTRVTGLRFAAGHASGVDTTAGPLLADTVVIASGGYVNRIDLVETSTYDAPGTVEGGEDEFAQGDAIDWAERFQLRTTLMGAIGWNTGLIGAPGADGTPIRITHRNEVPWVWVDRTGRRFVDESESWSLLIAGQERSRGDVWAVGTWDRWWEGAGELDRPFLDAARAAGAVVRCADRPDDLAQLLGIDPDGLAETHRKVEGIVAGVASDPFRRSASTFVTNAPWDCGFRIGHQAMKGFGGLGVTADGQVLGTDGAPVPGLWAVGEAAGMAAPGMGGVSGWDGSLSAVVWGGWRTAAAINASR